MRSTFLQEIDKVIDNGIQVKQIWKKRIRGEIADLACIGKKGPVVIAGENNTCHIVSRKGQPLKSIAFNAAPIAVKANRSATLFAVLDAEGNVHGFTCKGERQWKLHCEGAETIAMGRSNELLTSRPPYTIRYVNAGEKTEPVDIQCKYKPASFAPLGEEPLRIAVAGELGELGVVDESGRYVWEFNIGIQTGPMSFDPGSDTLIVSAFDEGIYAYDSAGESKGTLYLQNTVSNALVTDSPAGPVVAALSAENIMSLLDLEGTVLWEQKLRTPVAAWDISDRAAWLTVATTDGGIRTFATKFPTGQTSVISSDPITEEQGAIATDNGGGEQHGERTVSAVPQPEEAHVFGDISLMGGLLPRGNDRLRISPSGHRTAASLPGGEAIMTDTEGRLLIETRINAPARMLQSNSDVFFGIWNPGKLLIFNTENNRKNPIVPHEKIHQIDCSDDLRTIAFINTDDDLVIWNREGEQLGREQLSPPPTRIRVSPDGETIMVEDKQLRFLFFGRDGQLKKKHRFGGDLRFDHLILHDNFCTFASGKGPLILQDMEGKVIFAKKIGAGIKRLYLTNNALAIEEMSGVSRLMDREGTTIRRFEPPPGQSLIRMPSGNDPVIFQAWRKRLTAFTGHKKNLSAVWSFRCEAEIEAFDANTEGNVLAVAAGGRIYFVGPEPEKRK